MISSHVLSPFLQALSLWYHSLRSLHQHQSQFIVTPSTSRARTDINISPLGVRTKKPTTTSSSKVLALHSHNSITESNLQGVQRNWCVVWKPRSLRSESLRSREGTVDARGTTERRRRMGLRGSQTPFYREPTPAIMTFIYS